MKKSVRDLAALTRRAADRWGPRAALRFDETGEVFSFDDIERLTNKTANALTALGIQSGDRVAIMLANCADWPLTWVGIVKAGAVMVPVNRYYKSSDAGFQFSHTGVAAIVTSDDLAPGTGRTASGAEQSIQWPLSLDPVGRRRYIPSPCAVPEMSRRRRPCGGCSSVG